MAKRSKLDLNESPNPACVKCPRHVRRQNTDDGLCQIADSCVDGAKIRCVGPWTRDKLYFLTQYFGIFASGMKFRWEGNLHYIELCSGPGRCVDRESGIEMDGTALAVMGHPAFQHVQTATFLDYSPPVVAALNARIESAGLSGRALAIEANYNDPRNIGAIAFSRVHRGLVLVFVDPTDCSVPFETVAALAVALPNADFIINVALGTDATRNIKPAILNQDSRSRAKYAGFLGGETFFTDPEVIALAQAAQDDRLRGKFREYYRAAMRRLDYAHFATERVEHYYDLLFASRHEMGLKF
jgi:three-Cys-motif partner protein